MPEDQTTELDSLSFDDAHKIGSRMAAEVTNGRGEMSYDSPVSIEVEGVGTYTLKIEPDYEASPFDGNHGEWGELHWDTDAFRDQGARPSMCDGAARKLSSRQGPVWWQPPADEKGNAELAERVARFLAEDWSYVGVGLTLSIPGYEDQSASLWGVETDCGADYLAEVIGDMQGELLTAPDQDAQTMATKLRRWAESVARLADIASPGEYAQDAFQTVAEMRAEANALDPQARA